MLGQRGLVMCASSSLGGVAYHPMLGIHPRADFSSRAALLASGHIEASAAAAVLAATISQAAASTVWGVGPWEHDYSSLLSDSPPDEIAISVALAAAAASSDDAAHATSHADATAAHADDEDDPTSNDVDVRGELNLAAAFDLKAMC